MDTLAQDDLYSMVSLNSTEAYIDKKKVDSSKLTILETEDYSSLIPAVRNTCATTFPLARLVPLKYGGDFPFISNADEVALHINVHMRRLDQSLLPAIATDGEGQRFSFDKDGRFGTSKPPTEGEAAEESESSSDSEEKKPAPAPKKAKAKAPARPPTPEEQSDSESSSSDSDAPPKPKPKPKPKPTPKDDDDSESSSSSSSSSSEAEQAPKPKAKKQKQPPAKEEEEDSSSSSSSSDSDSA